MMQGPIPRKWLLSGNSWLMIFDPKVTGEALRKITPENVRLRIISQTFRGDWDKKQKWYGTEYRYEKVPEALMEEFKAGINIPSDKRVPEIHLPHNNNFIPDDLRVEKKEIENPALCPPLLSTNSLARAWWKKGDMF